LLFDLVLKYEAQIEFVVELANVTHAGGATSRCAGVFLLNSLLIGGEADLNSLLVSEAGSCRLVMATRNHGNKNAPVSRGVFASANIC
jgi:hypothetical protein